MVSKRTANALVGEDIVLLESTRTSMEFSYFHFVTKVVDGFNCAAAGNIKDFGSAILSQGLTKEGQGRLFPLPKSVILGACY